MEVGKHATRKRMTIRIVAKLQHVFAGSDHQMRIIHVPSRKANGKWQASTGMVCVKCNRMVIGAASDQPAKLAAAPCNLGGVHYTSSMFAARRRRIKTLDAMEKAFDTEPDKLFVQVTREECCAMARNMRAVLDKMVPEDKEPTGIKRLTHLWDRHTTQVWPWMRTTASERRRPPFFLWRCSRCLRTQLGSRSKPPQVHVQCGPCAASLLAAPVLFLLLSPQGRCCDLLLAAPTHM